MAADFSGLTNMPADAPRVSLSALSDEEKKRLFGNSNVEEFLTSTQKPGTPTAADAAKWGIGDNAVAPPDPTSLAVKPPMSDLTEQFGAFTRFTPKAEAMGFKNVPLPHARSFAADPAYGVEGAKYAGQNMTSDRDPEAQAYMDRASAWAQGQITSSSPGRVVAPTVGDLTDDQIKKLIADGVTPEQLYKQGRAFKTNMGHDAGVVYADPDATYRITNQRGKNSIAFEGKGLDGLDGAFKQATDLSNKENTKANWTVEMLDPATGQWSTVAHDDPAKGSFGKISDMALPALGAALAVALAAPTGGASLATYMALSGAGAAAGSVASSVGKGRSVGDTIKKAGVAGLTAAATAGVTGPGGLAGFKAPGSVPTGSFGNAAPGGLADLTAKAGMTAADDSVINVIAHKGLTEAVKQGLTAGGTTLATNAATMGGSSGGTTNPPPSDGSDIVVNAKALPPSLKVNPGVVAGAGTAATGAAANNYLDTTGDDITVTNKAPPPKNDPITGLPPLNVTTPQGTQPTTTTKQSTLDKIIAASKIASLGVGLVGGLFGGKGGGSGRTFPKGFGHLADDVNGSAFDSTMPAPHAWATRTPRQLPPQDIRPGRPDQLNYTYSDRGPGWIPPLPGQPDDPRYPSTGKGYAYGGGARAPTQPLAVRGPGTGSSDSIPAMLSDGEYVIDAPTVRKIGRGSTERGFTKLDGLRVQIHRGRPHRALKSLGAR